MNPTLDLRVGDALALLRALPEASVHCVVTSPPYWAVRDYNHPGQIGRERTVEAYVQKLVEIFAEVARVLRDDGTLWLNLGDCYTASGWGGGIGTKSAIQGTQHAQDREVRKLRSGPRLGHRSSFRRDRAPRQDEQHKSAGRLATKNLIGVPWRVAFALQAAGWVLRSDIIWHKPNPMPESVTDRPTKAHEYVFLLTKSGRYFYDAEAIKEQSSPNSHIRSVAASAFPGAAERDENRRRLGVNPKAANNGANGSKQNSSFSAAVVDLVPDRNKRSVWTITTYAYPGAHFATFPPDLVKPCILAGTSAGGCCSVCAAPYARIVRKGKPDLEHQRSCGGDANGEYSGKATKDFGAAGAQDASATKARILAGMRERKTVGWRPTCKCPGGAPIGRAVVLDPFAGSGTTGAVALELGRSALLLELNPDYAEQARARCAVTPGLLL